MTIRFEFDAVNRILLARIDGRLTEEGLADLCRAIRRYSVVTHARSAIFDFTSVIKFDISSEFIRQLSRREPAMLSVQEKPSVVIAPQTHAFGLARMFQILSEQTRPLFNVVRRMDEALGVLRAEAPEFKPVKLAQLNNSGEVAS